MREIVTFACGGCNRRNYTGTKNAKKTPSRLQIKKYCRFCRKHTVHKELK